MRSSYLICYDIADEKRLARVFRFLKGKATHVQYSVFFCRMTRPEVQRMKEELSARIDESEDDVRIYPLPGEYLVKVLGRGDRLPQGAELFLE